MVCEVYFNFGYIYIAGNSACELFGMVKLPFYID